MEAGNLPTPRYYLQAATVDNLIFVTGGGDYSYVHSAILSWDPATESWQETSNFAVGRVHHAAVAVPSSIFESECSELLSI